MSIGLLVVMVEKEGCHKNAKTVTQRHRWVNSLILLCILRERTLCAALTSCVYVCVFVSIGVSRWEGWGEFKGLGQGHICVVSHVCICAHVVPTIGAINTNKMTND